jgi:hypothetical protein
MFYEFSVTVPANTTKGSPVTEYLKLAHGIITGIDVQFPIGCFGLAHAQLFHHSFGQLPTNRQGSFSTDGYIIHVESPLEFTKAPYQVKALCWNTDDTYQHIITFRFDVVESKAQIWFMSILKGLEQLLKLFKIKV